MTTKRRTIVSAAVAVLSLVALVSTQNAVAANVEVSQRLGGDPIVGAVLMGTALALACVFFAAVVALFTSVAKGVSARQQAES